jgi:hypothetical protein
MLISSFSVLLLQQILKNSAVKSAASKLSMRITTSTMNLCWCDGCAGAITLDFTTR